MARSLKGIFNKDILAMSLGGATSGTISGFVTPILAPVTGAIPISGLAEILVGVGGQYFMKKGLINSYFKGVMIAGIANAIAGFIPQVTGTFPSGKKFNQLAIQGNLASQVDGAKFSYPEQNELYIHRNPVGSAPQAETVNAPAGTSHLMGKVPSIRYTH